MEPAGLKHYMKKICEMMLQPSASRLLQKLDKARFARRSAQLVGLSGYARIEPGGAGKASTITSTLNRRTLRRGELSEQFIAALCMDMIRSQDGEEQDREPPVGCDDRLHGSFRWQMTRYSSPRGERIHGA